MAFDSIRGAEGQAGSGNHLRHVCLHVRHLVSILTHGCVHFPLFSFCQVTIRKAACGWDGGGAGQQGHNWLFEGAGTGEQP